MPPKSKHTRLMQEGDQFLQRGDLDQAEQKYREALNKRPGSAEALYSIGAVYTHRGDFQSALEWAERAVAADPRLLPAQGFLGNVLLGLHRYEDALAALSLAVHDESNLVARVQMGLCCEALKRWEEAEEYFRAVLEHDLTYTTRFTMMALYNHSPFFADVHHALARVLQRQNKLDEAKLHYHLTKRVDPTTQLDPMYLEIMSTTDLENHPADEVEFDKPFGDAPLEEKLKYLIRLSDYSTLLDAAKLYKSEDLITYTVGIIHATQQMAEFYASARVRVVGDVLYGIEAAGLFAALQSPSWKRFFELAELVYTEQLSLEGSLEVLNHLEFAEDSIPLVINLAQRFVLLEPETGLTLALLVERVAYQTPVASLSVILVGEAYYRLRELDEALESFREALDLYKDAKDPRGMLTALTRIGNAQFQQGKFTDALSTLDEYMQLAIAQGESEDVIWGQYNHALTLFRVDRAEESYAECLMAASMVRDDTDAELRKDLATLLIQAGEKMGQAVPGEVLERLRYETVYQSESIDALLSQAAIVEEQGKLDEALSLLEQARTKAESIAPLATYVQVLFELGTLLGEMDRLTEATNEFRKALQHGGTISTDFDIWPILINLGILAVRQSQTEEAVTYFERALREARLHRSLDQERDTLEQLARVLIDVDPLRATTYFGEFLHLSNAPAEELPADWVEGVTSLEEGQFREALAAFERLSMENSPATERLLPLALANQGVAHMQLGEVLNAIRCWEKAADEWLERGNRDQAINVLGKVALAHRQQGKDYNRTLTHMSEIWQGIENSGSRRGTGVDLAQIMIKVGELSRAEKILAEILSIATSDQWRDVSDEMKIRQALGRVYRRTSRYAEAIEQYQAALTCALYLKDELAEGNIRGDMGIAYRYFGDLDAALEQYHQAIAIANRYQNRAAVAGHRLNLAASLFHLGRIEEGTSASLEALVVFDAEGDEDSASRVLIQMMEYIELDELPQEMQERIMILMDEGLNSSEDIIRTWAQRQKAYRQAEERNFEGAWTLLEEVISTYRTFGDRYNEALALLDRAYRLGHWDTTRAMSDVTKVRDLSLEMHQVHLRVKCEEFLLNDAIRKNDLAQVNHSSDALLLGWTQLRRRLKNDRDRIDFANNVSTIVDRCVAYFLHQGLVTRAFEVQEWGRAQALIDLLAQPALTSKQAGRQAVQDLLTQEAAILDNMQKDEIQVPKTLSSLQPVLADSPELERDLEAELDAVYQALEKYDPLYVSQKRGVSVDIARIQAVLSALARSAVIVTFDFVENEIVAMTLRSDTREPRAHRTGIQREQIEELLKTFHREMHVFRGNGSEAWYDQATLLLQSVAEEIRENDLVVLVPEGDLQLLPLQALRLPNDQLLVEYAAVVYTPSLTVLERLQQRQIAHENPLSHVLLCVGVAFPDEARAISLRFGDISTCLSGNYLAKDELQQMIAERRILHFACHGYFDPKYYLESGLVLHASDTPLQPEYLLRDEVLSLRDLMTWHLDSDLMVLSACETGLGKVAPSEFLGLSRGVLAAGVRAVIVTLWAIDDAATQTFMLAFYAVLQQQLKHNNTLDIAEALRRTQAQFMQETQVYNWAGFKLIGWPLVAWKGPKDDA